MSDYCEQCQRTGKLGYRKVSGCKCHKIKPTKEFKHLKSKYAMDEALSKEFNLSEKKIKWLYYHEQDVKEFIRLLKDKFPMGIGSVQVFKADILKEIDKLAGKSLV